MRKRLSSHAVLLARACHFDAVLTRKLQSVADVVLVQNLHDAIDRGLVQVACIISESATLTERYRGRGWFCKEGRRLFLIRRGREHEVAFLLFVRSGAVIKDFFDAENEQ